MKERNKFLPEVGERELRMGQEHHFGYALLWEGKESIAFKIGRTPQTVLEWVERQEVDSGLRVGSSSSNDSICAAQPPAHERDIIHPRVCHRRVPG